MRRDDLDGGIPTLAVALPDDLKERLEAFVPPPVAATLESLEQLPVAYDRPLERWNAETEKHERGTECIPSPCARPSLGLPGARVCLPPAPPHRSGSRPGPPDPWRATAGWGIVTPSREPPLRERSGRGSRDAGKHLWTA